MSLQPFGTCAVGPVSLLTLGRAPGVELELLDLGATVHALRVTCGDGVRRNVVLGHATAQEHLDSAHYLGAVVGRYANRIAAGAFHLDGVEHRVGAHDRGNALHGGPDGFDRRTWTVVEHGPDTAVLRLVSPDGDQGYPGTVTAEARYSVAGDAVQLVLTATTTAPCPVNLTSHAYFDLDGEGSGTAEGHLLQVHADAYLPVDSTGIPTGGPASVAGTPFDLRQPTVVAGAARSAHPQVRASRGIDHDYVPDGTGWREVAVLESRRTRTRLTLSTDQVGLQVYTGNFLDGSVRGTSGGLYRQGDGIALEPQAHPDSPNRPDLGDVVLRPGEVYRAALQWQLSTAEV